MWGFLGVATLYAAAASCLEGHSGDAPNKKGKHGTPTDLRLALSLSVRPRGSRPLVPKRFKSCNGSGTVARTRHTDWRPQTATLALTHRRYRIDHHAKHSGTPEHDPRRLPKVYLHTYIHQAYSCT